MPYVVAGEKGGSSGVDVTTDYAYKYPNGLNLRPDSPTHQKLLTEILSRAQESYNVMSCRHDQWSDVDKTLTCYISTDDAEEAVKANDERKPVSIVIPYSFATMETIITYLMMAFLDEPIFRYEGAGPEDVLKGILLEKTIDMQMRKAKAGLALHTMFRDNLAYGFGAVAPIWVKDYAFRTEMVERQSMLSMLGVRKPEMDRVQRRVVKYEGNRLINIDPYHFLPDPNVPIHDVQRGEWMGWVHSTNKILMLEEEKNSEGNIFNVRYLSGKGEYRSQFAPQTDRTKKYGITQGQEGYSTTPVDQLFLYVNLVPKQWGLGSSEYPEKWLFCVAGDKIITQAQPLGLDHNQFPVAVAASEYDGYTVASISRMEVVGGLQNILDWLVNSHITNVRKAINDMLIVDPYMVNINDLKSPKPGKLIRLRRSAWGRGGVDQFVKQLKVEDITQGHIKDAGVIVEFMQQVSAATDTVQGFMRKTSERITATENQNTRTSALSRLAKIAKIVSMQAMYDLGYMLASHTQQLMDEETFVNLTGEWREVLMNTYGQDTQRIAVGPQDIQVNFDVVMKDGSVNTPDYLQTWVDMFKIMAENPLLMQRFDIVGVFKHIAKLGGAKDVDRFEVMPQQQVPPVQGQVAPDEAVAREAEKGNLVPIPTGGMM